MLKTRTVASCEWRSCTSTPRVYAPFISSNCLCVGEAELIDSINITCRTIRFADHHPADASMDESLSSPKVELNPTTFESMVSGFKQRVTFSRSKQKQPSASTNLDVSIQQVN